MKPVNLTTLLHSLPIWDCSSTQQAIQTAPADTERAYIAIDRFGRQRLRMGVRSYDVVGWFNDIRYRVASPGSPGRWIRVSTETFVRKASTSTL